MTTRECTNCCNNFELTSSEEFFYQKIDVPQPKICPTCRQQQRLAFRNERTLYRRSCDLTGEDIISIYSVDSLFTIYDQSAWWSDQWDPRDYGREFDFSRTFFEQFSELTKVVPRRNLLYYSNENSEYTNGCSHNKDCYLLFSSDYCLNCYYVTSLERCTDCIDSTLGSDSELCYQCFDFHRCYHNVFCRHIRGCSDCVFCEDCVGCHRCAFCVGLRNAEYCIFNRKYSPDEYAKKIEEFNVRSFRACSVRKSDIEQFAQTQPKPALRGYGNEESLGDYIYNSKKSSHCFNLSDSSHCTYIFDGVKCVDCTDCTEIGHAELCYQAIEAFPNVYSVRFSFFTADSSFLEYCDHCYNSKNLFGCVGMRNNEYCILNRQLSQADYYSLRERIVSHMKETGEWGEFFPAWISPFAYNETSAKEYAPLTAAQAVAKGYRWQEEAEVQGIIQSYSIPDTIADVSDEITALVLQCLGCGRNYKIIKQELEFYRKVELPVPRECPECRHLERVHLRNPRRFRERDCGKCSRRIPTTFEPSAEAVVYCSECYEERIY